MWGAFFQKGLKPGRLGSLLSKVASKSAIDPLDPIAEKALSVVKYCVVFSNFGLLNVDRKDVCKGLVYSIFAVAFLQGESGLIDVHQLDRAHGGLFTD